MDDNAFFRSNPQPTSSNQPTQSSNPVEEAPQVQPQSVQTPVSQQSFEEKPAFSGFAKPLQKSPTSTNGPQPAQEQNSSKSPPFGGLKNLIIKVIIGVVILIIVIFVVSIFFSKKPSQAAKLTWWGLWEDKQVMQSVIDDFQRQNPNITVEYIKQDPKQYRERLFARIENASGPDIFTYHNTWYPMINSITSPLPVDVISIDDFKKNYYSVMQQDLVHNGGLYGIPIGADTLSLFVNTEILNAAGINVPTNWDEFVKAAKSMTVKDENGAIKTSGAAMGTYCNITHAADVISLLFVQQGVDLNKFSTYAADQADVLNFYTSFATGDDNTWDNTLDSSIMLFSQGKLALYFGYSWDIFTIQRLNKDLQFKIFPVPGLFDRKSSIASYWVEGVSAKSSHQKEAFIFMKYLAKKETAQKLFTEAAKTRSFGAPYARRDLASTLKDNALVYPFVIQLVQAKSSFFVSDTYDGDGGLNSSSNTYLGNAINSIINDHTSAQSAVDTLDKGVEQVLSKYVSK